MELEPYVGSISGSSASAAIASLTSALLKDLRIDDSIAITGVMLLDTTIGPVSGLVKKIEVARKAGVKVVAIPRGQLVVKDPVTNTTVNLAVIARKYGLSIREASSLYDVLEILGYKLSNTASFKLKPSSIHEFKTVASKWVVEFNETYMRLHKKVGEALDQCRNIVMLRIINKTLQEADRVFDEAL